MSLLDFESREESLQVGDDQLLQPHEARGSVTAFRWRNRHQLGKRVGYLDPGEALLAARILHHDGKIQAQVGDMRERPARVKGERSEDQEDGSMEVLVQASALFFAKVGIIDQHDAGPPELRADIVTQAAVGLIGEAHDLRADRSEKLRSRHASGGGGPDSRRGLLLQTGDAHHEEFVDVGTEDGEKVQAFEKGIRRLLCLGQHALLKGEETELAVLEEPGVVKGESLRPGSGRVFVGWHELAGQ